MDQRSDIPVPDDTTGPQSAAHPATDDADPSVRGPGLPDWYAEFQRDLQAWKDGKCETCGRTLHEPYVKVDIERMVREARWYAVKTLIEEVVHIPEYGPLCKAVQSLLDWDIKYRNISKDWEFHV
jgi:hypothetical protein